MRPSQAGGHVAQLSRALRRLSQTDEARHRGREAADAERRETAAHAPDLDDGRQQERDHDAAEGHRGLADSEREAALWRRTSP